MAGIQFQRHLIHQAIIERDSGAGTVQDSFGGIVETFSPVGTVDCRFISKMQRIADESIGLVMVGFNKLLLNTGEDVQVNDQVRTITLKSTGGTVDAGPYMINAVLDRNSTKQHHTALELEKIDR